MTGTELAKGAAGGTRKKFLFRRNIRRTTIDDAIWSERRDGIADDGSMKIVDYLSIAERLGDAGRKIRFDGMEELRAGGVLHITPAGLGGD